METNRKPTDWNALVNRVLVGNRTGNFQETVGKKVGNFGGDFGGKKFPKFPTTNQKASIQRTVWHYRIKGSNWLILISPCDDMTEIKRQLQYRFGNRFIEVRPCEKFHQQ